MDLTGRVAVVTGAGKGIGRATAKALVEAGAMVLAMSRTPGDLASLCEETDDTMEGQCAMFVGDVTSEEDVAAAFSEAQLLGDVSIVVNAAGAAAFGPTVAFDLDDWVRVTDTNLTGAFLCCREALRAMGDGGHIINVASIAGHVGLPNSAAYSASKWGLVGMSKSIAAEVRAGGRSGIHVTVLSPGSTDTALWDGQGWKPDAADMLKADDVAAAILHVVSQPDNVSTDEMMIMPSRGIL